MNNNLEKRIIPFGKPLHKKDIKTFLSSLSDRVSYDMSNMGDIIFGVDKPIQNECSGNFVCNEIKLSYEVHIHVDKVYHMQLSYPQQQTKKPLIV